MGYCPNGLLIHDLLIRSENSGSGPSKTPTPRSADPSQEGTLR